MNEDLDTMAPTPDVITTGIIAEIRAERRQKTRRWRGLKTIALVVAAPWLAWCLYNVALPLFTSGPHDCRAPILMFVWNLPAWALVPPEWFAAFVRWSVQFCVHG